MADMGQGLGQFAPRAPLWNRGLGSCGVMAVTGILLGSIG